MTTCNILPFALATILSFAGVMPCGANATAGADARVFELNKSVTTKVLVEGLTRARVAVPYSEDLAWDLVAVRWTARGTNTGTGGGLPATGRAVQLAGTTPFQMADGPIAEERTCASSLGLMKQPGMLQTTAAAPTRSSAAAAATR